MEKIKITFLGTSDAIPSAERNHTSILLSYTNENILIDCGEGTQRQFRVAKINPCKITKILITHWHSDHVLGIPGLLDTIEFSGYNKNLEIYGPRGTKKYISELLNLFKIGNKISLKVIELDKEGKFFENEEFMLSSKKMTHGIPCNAYCFQEKSKLKIDKGKLKKYKISPGPHLQNIKKGKQITFQGKKYNAIHLTTEIFGRKICFVLDTNNNKKIIPFVNSSDLLVMEGQFDSSLEKRAKEFHHMTSKQCAQIAKRAKIKRLILTHLSNRYNNDQSHILKEAKNIFKNTEIAKDFMEITL